MSKVKEKLQKALLLEAENKLDLIITKRREVERLLKEIDELEVAVIDYMKETGEYEIGTVKLVRTSGRNSLQPLDEKKWTGKEKEMITKRLIAAIDDDYKKVSLDLSAIVANKDTDKKLKAALILNNCKVEQGEDSYALKETKKS